MRIAIVGTGGVGGYFGSLLARAGEDVTFIARGYHLDAMSQHGLQIFSDLSGNFVIHPEATQDAKSVGPVDVVIFCVKMYHNAQAIPGMSPLVDEETTVLTLQNGVENGDQISKVYPDAHVMIGSAFVQARIKEPGVIVQQGQLGRVVFGEINPGKTDKGERMFEAFQRGTWNVELTENAPGLVWQKFIYLAGSAAVNAASGATYGEMRQIASTRALLEAVFAEGAALAKAKGVVFDQDPVEKSLELMDGFPADGQSSLAKDFAAGSSVELEGLTGAIVRMGREFDIPTPLNDALYAILEPAAKKIETSKT